MNYSRLDEEASNSDVRYGLEKLFFKVSKPRLMKLKCLFFNLDSTPRSWQNYGKFFSKLHFSMGLQNRACQLPVVLIAEASLEKILYAFSMVAYIFFY